MSARRFLRLAHGWIGVVATAFLILVALSGAALAFMPEMFKAEYGAMLDAPRPPGQADHADLDRIIAAARDGYGKPIDLIGVLMPDSRVAGLEVAMPFGTPPGGDEHDVALIAVDPWTARHQGQFLLHDSFGHQFLDFHFQLLMGDIGVAFVAVLGLLLAAFALTGLWLWWPRDGGVWRKARRLELSGGAKRAWFSLHGWTGVWLALLILFFGITGSATARPDWFAPLLAEAPEAPPAGLGFERRCAGGVTPGQALATARALAPGRRPAYVDFGATPAEPYHLTFKGPRDLDQVGGDRHVFVHATCPGIVHALDMAARPPSERVGAALLSLHGGYTFGGMLGDVLVILTGLGLALSAGSGTYIFFTRTLKRRRPPAEEETAAPLLASN